MWCEQYLLFLWQGCHMPVTRWALPLQPHWPVQACLTTTRQAYTCTWEPHMALRWVTTIIPSVSMCVSFPLNITCKTSTFFNSSTKCSESLKHHLIVLVWMKGGFLCLYLRNELQRPYKSLFTASPFLLIFLLFLTCLSWFVWQCYCSVLLF